jgi:ABC-type branched-subunit amino acid transport system ATPase component
MVLSTAESMAAGASAAAGVVAAAGAATVTVPETAGLLREELARRRTETHAEGPLLRIENVSVHFGGLKAVSEVSFNVEEGSITALIGPNGAGKTTLFNAVSRLQHMTDGRIWFEDTELTKLDAASAARLGMARTFQNLRIFVNMSVLENVLVGCHRHEKSGFWGGGLGFPSQRREEKRSRAQAMDALTLVGLQDQANLRASSLPYGQQRLVEIARALASEPRLLLLDEPAAGTNASEREDLIARIATIREAGVTVLLVEHDMDLVMDISDVVNVLDYGKLIASGTPEKIQQDQKVIAAYLGAGRGERDLCATRDLVDGESCPVPEDMLVIENLVTAYGSIEALHGVSLTVPKGMVVAVLGANGAGKSTLLHTISGIVRSSHGRVLYQGADITRLAPEKIVARGLCQVPEGRQLFPSLSVEDNLIVGASGRRDRSTLADDIAYVYDLFPVLGERRKQEAGTLSGGEQQMLAIGRGLAGHPSLLLLDEPSMGLAPMTVERIFEALAKLNERGITMLMVEQNAEMALSIAHLAVVLVTGDVVLSGTATKLRQDDRVRASYLGD